jgi:hypothetical protein
VRPARLDQRLQHRPTLIGQHGLPPQSKLNVSTSLRFRR